MTTLDPARFPAHFAWGTATSSYQIEGAIRADGRGASIWDTFDQTPGRVHNGDTGTVACDHYHRWEADLDLMHSLGLNAYRFSIAWPRVIPAGRGAVNPKGLDFYDRLVDGLLVRGIAPWPTLFHWDLPQALQDQGGWLARDSAEAFADYASVVAGRLGDRVAGWFTLNEPWVHGIAGHAVGMHAPGLTGLDNGLQAAHNSLRAHGLGAQAVRAHSSRPVGLALSVHHVQPASPDPADLRAAALLKAHFDDWFFDPLFGRGYPEVLQALYGSAVPEVLAGDMATLSQPLDFVGLNYYTRHLVQAPTADTPPDPLSQMAAALGFPVQIVPAESRSTPVTAMGWEVYPQGLQEVVQEVHCKYAPGQILISENGSAFPDTVQPDGSVHDGERREYLRSHLEVCQALLEQGVPLGGYFAWSLLDNFEWAEGYRPRFGLVRVDYPTQARTVKASGRFYAETIAASRVAHP